MRHATLASIIRERNEIRRRNWGFVRIMMASLYVSVTALLVAGNADNYSWSQVCPIALSWLVVTAYSITWGD